MRIRRIVRLFSLVLVVVAAVWSEAAAEFAHAPEKEASAEASRVRAQREGAV